MEELKEVKETPIETIEYFGKLFVFIIMGFMALMDLLHIVGGI